MNKKGRKETTRQPLPKLRIALFTHDTFGLGHVKRCLRISWGLSAKLPHSSILLVTGSPVVHALKSAPPNWDYVKIPTVAKTGASGSQPPHLPLSVMEATLIRSRIIKETILALSPDVFIVDNFPLGSRSELLPVLQALRDQPTKTILGLRDVLGAPETIENEWTRTGIYDVLNRYYDKILIYGSRNIFDAIKKYNIPPGIAEKVRFCGYLTATDPFSEGTKEIQKELGFKGPFILATGGGGGDAYPLLSTFIEAMKQFPKKKAITFTGPLMGVADLEKLKAHLNGSKNVQLRTFVPDLRPYLKAAELVVSMCGYNTASEILVQQPKAIVIPRTWKYGEHKKRKSTTEEQEQILRAQALEKRGFIHLLEPEHVNTERLVKKMKEVLRKKKKRSRGNMNVNGLKTAVQEIIKTAKS